MHRTNPPGSMPGSARVCAGVCAARPPPARPARPRTVFGTIRSFSSSVFCLSQLTYIIYIAYPHWGSVCASHEPPRVDARVQGLRGSARVCAGLRGSPPPPPPPPPARAQHVPGRLFGSTKGNSLLANDVSFQIFFVRLQTEHIQAVGKPCKIVFKMNMAYSFPICSRGTDRHLEHFK